MEYSSSIKALIRLDIVEYYPGTDKPMYDIIIGKQTMHNLGVVLDFKESTIQIDKILLPMRNITNLQLKMSISWPIAFFIRKRSVTQSKYSVTEIDLLAIVETLKEFKGILWGQSIKIFTDHKNLTKDALGLTSDRVYRWRLLLEEYAPDIVYIKGVHNTVADAISRLEYNPKLNPTNEYTHATVRVPTGEPSTDPSKWKTVAKHWRCYNKCYATPNTSNVEIDTVFANGSEEDDIYPLATIEIAEA